MFDDWKRMSPFGRSLLLAVCSVIFATCGLWATLIAKSDIIVLATGFGILAFSGMLGIISVLEYRKSKKGKEKENETK